MSEMVHKRWRFRLRDSDWSFTDDPVFAADLMRRPHFIVEEIT